MPSWRRKFSDGQTTKLEEVFIRQKYITGKERADIAKKLSLTTKQVKTWFQNRRTKWKREKQRNPGFEMFIQNRDLIEQAVNYQRSFEHYLNLCELQNNRRYYIIDTDAS